jgi:hypothetical protein
MLLCGQAEVTFYGIIPAISWYFSIFYYQKLIIKNRKIHLINGMGL